MTHELIITTYYYDIHSIVTDPAVHFTSLRSGSHSPFSIHVAELGPISVSPSLQLNMMFSPSRAGSSYPSTITPSLASISGSEHLPIYVAIILLHYYDNQWH